MFAIYKIINVLNQECYIGATKYPDRRWQEHLREVKRNRRNYTLYNAMRKYGIQNFSYQILELGENEIYGFGVAEPMYVRWLSPKYNMTAGGEGVNEPSPEARLKMRKKKLGISRGPFSEEHRQRIGDSLRGKPKSTEHGRRISLAKKGCIPWNKRVV